MENFTLKRDKFLQGEFNTFTSIRLDKTYIDMVDDLKAGLLLSQIIYWHLPSQETGEIRLKVEHPKSSGNLWLVKRRKDWFDEIRLSPKEYDKAKSKLVEKNIIKVELHQFRLEENNYKEAPMDFIQINWNVFLELRDKVIESQIETKKEKEKEKKQRELLRISKNNPQINPQPIDDKNDIDQKGMSSDTNGCKGDSEGCENNNSHYPQNPQGSKGNTDGQNEIDIDQRGISDIDQKGISDIDQRGISTNTYITPTTITPTNTTGERENNNIDSNNINYSDYSDDYENLSFPPSPNEEFIIDSKTSLIIENTYRRYINDNIIECGLINIWCRYIDHSAIFYALIKLGKEKGLKFRTLHSIFENWYNKDLKTYEQIKPLIDNY